MRDFTGTKHTQYIQKVEIRFRYVITRNKNTSKAERRIAALLQEKEEEIVIDNEHSSKVSHFLISIL